jgi:hypothetical protein
MKFVYYGTPWMVPNSQQKLGKSKGIEYVGTNTMHMMAPEKNVMKRGSGATDKQQM